MSSRRRNPLKKKREASLLAVWLAKVMTVCGTVLDYGTVVRTYGNSEDLQYYVDQRRSDVIGKLSLVIKSCGCTTLHHVVIHHEISAYV